LSDNSILITANMQSETGFPSSHQLKSYVASKSRLKLAARAILSADAGLLVLLRTAFIMPTSDALHVWNVNDHHFPYPDILLTVCHFQVSHFPDPDIFVRHFSFCHFPGSWNILSVIFKSVKFQSLSFMCLSF